MYMRALGGKEPRNRLADTRGSSADQCDLILQHGNIITRPRADREMYRFAVRSFACSPPDNSL